MKKLRWSDLSLVSKIVIEVGVLAALMFTINMLFYVRIMHPEEVQIICFD